MTDRPAVQRLAVLGSPIAHSKSPALHEAAYRQLGLDWTYSRIEVGSGDLSEFLLGLDSSWRGLSLTMPLKEEALSLADSVDVQALLTGVANTITFSHQADQADQADQTDPAPEQAPAPLSVQGFNTDVSGIVGALGEVGVTAASEVLILGAGATARSAVVAAAQLGAERVVLAARSPTRAAEASAVAHSSGLQSVIGDLSDTLGRASESPVVISTLPGGSLSASDVERFVPRTGSVLLDVAYDPWPSALAHRWQQHGETVVSGLWMLAHQALVQVRIFVAGDPELRLPDEPRVFAAMLDAVGLSRSA